MVLNRAAIKNAHERRGGKKLRGETDGLGFDWLSVVCVEATRVSIVTRVST